MEAASRADNSDRRRHGAAAEIGRVELIAAGLGDARRLVAIEAPTGFGKSVLVAQFAATFEHELWLYDLTSPSADDVASLPADAAAWCVVIDNAEQLHEASAIGAVVSSALDRGATVVVAGRRVPDAIWFDAQLQLKVDDLLLTTKQVEPHLPSSLSAEQRAAAAEVLCDVSRGWMLAVADPLERIQAAAGESADADRRVDKTIADIVRRGTAQSHLLEPAAQQLAPEDLSMVRTLAVIDRFDEEILTLLKATDGFAERASFAGLLTVRDGPSLPDVFRAIFCETSSPPGDVDCRALADHLVERGEIAQAIEVCVAFGNHEQAAETIAGLEHRHGFLVDVDDFNRSITLLPAAAARHPRVYLVQCWVNVIAAQVADAMRALRRAHESVQVLDPERTMPVHAEILAEQAFYASIDGDRERSERHLEALHQFDIEGSNTATEARVLEARAGLAGLQSTATSFGVANRHLSAAIAIWRRHGDSARLVSALMRLAINVLEPMGRYRQSIDVLDEALEQPSVAAFDRARIEMFRSRILPVLGENEAAAQARSEANRLASRLNMPWITGMTAWAEMRANAFASDEDATLRALTEARDRLGELLNHETGAMFWCEAADALARFGRLADAEEFLVAAHAIADGESFVVVADAAVEARAGDAARALELIGTAPTVDPGMVWFLHALAASALARLDHRGDALARMSMAQSELDQLGQHDVLRATERELVDALADTSGNSRLLPSTNSTASTASTRSTAGADTTSTRLLVFDRFAVERNGEFVSQLPRGRSAVLVKFLVVNQGRVVIDQAIDALWPGCDLPTGRQRLRNVLQRCRKSLGPIVERDGDCLAFGNGVTSDYSEALDLAEGACVREPDSLEAADAAVAALSGRLLPDDRYEDWAELARADLDRRRERVRDHQQRLAAQLGVSRPS